MLKDFFVMLNTQNSGITPLMNGEEIATFDTPIEAKDAGKENMLGSHFGFEVFCRGEGRGY